MSVYNSQGFYQVESGGGRPGDGVAQMQIQQSGVYYVRVEAGQGTGGLRDQYILDVQILPTGLTNFPNLVVTSANPPADTGIQSGQSVTFSYTVQNLGAVATAASQWSDRVVISPNQILGDADDIPLGTNNGLFTHSGMLNTNEGYTASQIVQLPDGISGDFRLIVKVDALGQVNEGLLSGDNVTISTNTFHVDLASYPDLQVENLSVTDPGNSNIVTVSWNVANRGAATAASGFYNQLLIRNLATGITLQNTEYQVTQPLAVGATTSYVATVSAIPPGTYQVAVTADSHRQVYEWAACGHDCAEQNTAVTNFQIIQFFNVTVQASPTNGGFASGGGRYQAVALVTASAIPETNSLPFLFVNWTEGGLTQSTNNPYTFSATRDRQLVANFDLPSYQIAATNNPPTGGTISGAGTFKYGTTNVLTAVPGFGYRFARWTENGVTNGTNATLTTVVYSNHLFVANYSEANPFHSVTIFTLPPGITNIPGFGTYSNGASLAISAPSLITQEPNYYTFKRWTLNGTGFTNLATFTKTFSTTDSTNLNFTAEYNTTSIRPMIIAATANIGAPVPATTNFAVTLQFDRSMQTGTPPALTITNPIALIQASVPTGGVWLTTALANDTYRSAPITFVSGMDGTNLLFASQASDLDGAQLSLTNVLKFVVDATPPSIVNLTAAPAPMFATITWTTGEPATSEVQFGLDAGYGLTSGINSSLVTSHSVRLNGLIPGTTYHYRALSRDVAGNTTTSNDRTFTTKLAPDLRVTGMTLLPPTNIQSGIQLTVIWTNTNTGLGPTTNSWQDQLVVSNLTTGQRILAANVYYDATSLGNLSSGDYRTRQFIFNLPDGLPGVGQLLFSVTADINNAIAEYNASGTAESNNSATTTATSVLAPYPDLVVTGISVPATAVPGAPVQISWTVTNQGNATATGPWTDSLSLSSDSVIGGDQSLTSIAYAATLAPGQSLVITQTVVLPSSIIGNRYVVVTTDSGNLVFEAIKTNNISISATAIQLLNPDLVVDSVTVPSSAKFGDAIPVVWTIRNAGNAPATGGWNDQISLSTSSTSLAGATPLVTLPIVGVSPLAVGATYTRTQSVTLPLSSIFAPTNYFVLITTDSSNTVFELNEANNTGPSGSIALSLPQLPDFVVTGIFSPTNGFAGQPVTLAWSVTNQGAAAATGPWTDTILLSTNSSGSNAQLVVSLTYSNLLNAGSSLMQTSIVTLPSSAFGQMFFVVNVNSSNDVYEASARSNNISVAGSPVSIQAPDLAVIGIQSVVEVLTDRRFDVSWTVTNQTIAPAIGSWTDRVYLSVDGLPAHYLLLGEFPFSGVVPGNQNLTRIQSVSIPRYSVTNGYYYLVVVTDNGNTLNEGANYGNNTLIGATPVHVTRTPLPDLTVESIPAPAVAFSGQTITVRWTVRNVGAASTDTASWSDQVFLSTTTSSGNSVAWGNRFQNVSYLATNDAYIGSADLRIPLNAFGTYYIVVRTGNDRRQRRDDEGEAQKEISFHLNAVFFLSRQIA